MIKWATQSNLVDVETNDSVNAAAKNIGCETLFVPMEPFITDLPAIDLDTDEPVIFYGSINMVKGALKSDYKPGVWYDEVKFSYLNAIEENGEMMLNHDGKIASLENLFYFEGGHFFVRPLNDLKQFNGMLVTPSNFHEFQYEIQSSGLYDDMADIDVLMCRQKTIYAEYRCVMVDGCLMDAMKYMSGSNLVEHPVSRQQCVELTAFLENIKMPAPVCVVDVALVSIDQYKVIEFNCFNASGFYGHDIPKIVKAVTDYAENQ